MTLKAILFAAVTGFVAISAPATGIAEPTPEVVAIEEQAEKQRFQWWHKKKDQVKAAAYEALADKFSAEKVNAELKAQNEYLRQENLKLELQLMNRELVTANEWMRINQAMATLMEIHESRRPTVAQKVEQKVVDVVTEVVGEVERPESLDDPDFLKSVGDENVERSAEQQ